MDHNGMVLYAYVGEDELGSGEVGLKAAQVPAGFIPLVAIESDRFKLERARVREQLAEHSRTWGKEIQLVKFVAVETVFVV